MTRKSIDQRRLRLRSSSAFRRSSFRKSASRSFATEMREVPRLSDELALYPNPGIVSPRWLIADQV